MRKTLQLACIISLIYSTVPLCAMNSADNSVVFSLIDKSIDSLNGDDWKSAQATVSESDRNQIAEKISGLDVKNQEEILKQAVALISLVKNKNRAVLYPFIVNFLVDIGNDRQRFVLSFMQLAQYRSWAPTDLRKFKNLLTAFAQNVITDTLLASVAEFSRYFDNVNECDLLGVVSSCSNPESIINAALTILSAHRNSDESPYKLSSTDLKKLIVALAVLETPAQLSAFVSKVDYVLFTGQTTHERIWLTTILAPVAQRVIKPNHMDDIFVSLDYYIAKINAYALIRFADGQTKSYDKAMVEAITTLTRKQLQSAVREIKDDRGLSGLDPQNYRTALLGIFANAAKPLSDEQRLNERS